jgi:peptide/nickel transport system permease protein/oligopeptide transport system permease protein
MGTDNLGRDMWTRVIHGGRISLTMGLAVGVLALITGVPLGLAGGYAGGWTDRIITGVMDTLMAFPALLLAIALAAVLGQSLWSGVAAIAVVELPRFQRVTRSQVLSVRQLEFVEAARAMGAPASRIVGRHILPNVTAPIVVQLSLSISFAILAEGALSFLGLSVPPPAPAWGFMLNVGRGYLEQAPWVALFPGLAIALAVLGFNLLGDALRDLLDPRMRSAQG